MPEGKVDCVGEFGGNYTMCVVSLPGPAGPTEPHLYKHLNTVRFHLDPKEKYWPMNSGILYGAFMESGALILS